MPAASPEVTATAPYDDRFFDGLNVDAEQSAATIVPLLLELIIPGSIVDVGCGEGAWLHTFAQHGIDDYLGIDGDYVRRDRLKIPADRFVATDLQTTFNSGRVFDLAICLEVGEHLDAPGAPLLVESLVRSAPVVCFSAAIPGQGGTDHRNEQWPGYWADLFATHNYACYDVLRPRLWQNPKVAYWYAQNALLFISNDARSRYPAIESTGAGRPDARVHPVLWNKLTQQHQSDRHHIAHPGVKTAGQSLFRAACEWIERRLAAAASV